MPDTLPLTSGEWVLRAEGFTYALHRFFVWAELPRPVASLEFRVLRNAVLPNLLVPRLTAHCANRGHATLAPGQRCRRLGGIHLILITGVWQVFHRFILHALHSLVG